MQRIPVAGPWITQKEIDCVADAAANAWYENSTSYHERFERAFADYIGVRFAVALPSCTSAIHLALAALGVGPGDEVVVPDITWIASAAPVGYVGATPVFADIDPQSWCLSAESFAACVSARTKAVIPVDLYGNMPEMEALRAVASRHGVAIIEDAAEAIGSEYDGRKSGSFGDAGVFSFHGSKTLTTGEGGMLVTDRDDLYRRVLVLRDHGRLPGDRMFRNSEVAYKYKMSALQAALGLAQLERIDELLDRKRAIFSWYRDSLAGVDGVTLNREAPRIRNTYWMVTAIFDRSLGLAKEDVMSELYGQGIDCRPFFHPLSSLPAYQGRPEAEQARRRNEVSYDLSPRGVNLPSALSLTRKDVDRVCHALKHRLEQTRRGLGAAIEETNSMPSPTRPRVSIGMPVYNGEKYLRAALGDLIAQDYPDFELIISDNGSSDGTEAICREFEAADPRIRYVRHASNRGAVWNFAFVAREARGEYFMWAAHDDRWHPSYVRKCVDALDAHSDAVLCCSEINFIDASGSPSYHYPGYKNIETLGMTLVERVHELMSRFGWFAIYGLIRREAVTRLPLDLSVYGADVVALLELLLMGNIAKLHEPLFSSRILSDNKTAEDYQRQFGSSARATTAPYTGLAVHLVESVYRSSLSPREKAEVFADFILTLTWHNPAWRNAISRELLGWDPAPDDQSFAVLLALVLARSVSLEDTLQNPVLQAAYRASCSPQDILAMAKQVRQLPASFLPPSYEERYRRGIQLFEDGQFEEASRLMGESLRAAETADRWSDWATARLACDDADGAERGFLRALWIDPGHAAAAKLGILLASQGRTREAVAYLERSLPRVDASERPAILELVEDCRSRLGQPLATPAGASA